MNDRKIVPLHRAQPAPVGLAGQAAEQPTVGLAGQAAERPTVGLDGAASKAALAANDDLRPARLVVIRPAFPLWQFAICAIAVALVGFWLGLGHS